MAEGQTRQKGGWRMTRKLSVVAAAAALLFSVGCGLDGRSGWLTPVRAESMGQPEGDIPELGEEALKELGSDVVEIRVLRDDGSVGYLVGRGLDSETVSFPPGGPVEFTYEENGTDIIVTGRLSKAELGVSEKEPVVLVVPGVIVRVGSGTCWWSCSGSGGGSECQCKCTPSGGQCPSL